MKKVTNYERIKNMSIEEMVLFLDDMQVNCFSQDCENCKFHKMRKEMHRACKPRDIFDWLNSEVDDG